jgi:hypothetical protein
MPSDAWYDAYSRACRAIEDAHVFRWFPVRISSGEETQWTEAEIAWGEWHRAYGKAIALESQGRFGDAMALGMARLDADYKWARAIRASSGGDKGKFPDYLMGSYFGS